MCILTAWNGDPVNHNFLMATLRWSPMNFSTAEPSTSPFLLAYTNYHVHFTLCFRRQNSCSFCIILHPLLPLLFFFFKPNSLQFLLTRSVESHSYTFYFIAIFLSLVIHLSHILQHTGDRPPPPPSFKKMVKIRPKTTKSC